MTEDPKATGTVLAKKPDEILAKASIELGERGIIPKNIDEAYRLAVSIQRSGLSPASLKTPEAILVAIMAGMELGFAPMTALRSMYVIGGLPTLYGEAALALVRQSGLMEDFSKVCERDDKGEPIQVTVTSKRKGTATALVTIFTRKQAEKARLWGGSNPNWTSRPDVMMGWRAIGQHLKDQYPDVLRGLNITETMDEGDFRRARGTSPVTSLAPKPSSNDPLIRIVDAEAVPPSSSAPAHQPENKNGDAQEPVVSAPTKEQLAGLKKFAAHVIAEIAAMDAEGNAYTPTSIIEEIAEKKIGALTGEDVKTTRDALDDMLKSASAVV